MKRTITIIAGGLILFTLAWYIRPEIDQYFKKQKLVSAYMDYKKLGEEDAYEKYYTPKDKATLSYEEIEKRRSMYRPIKWIESEVIEASIFDNSGKVRATESYCPSDECNKNEIKEITTTLWFQYLNSEWYLDAFHPNCVREAPYQLADEFDRVLSLITQRFRNSPRAEDQEFGKLFSNIRNCLDIKYAKSEKDMKGAEGMFYFRDDSPTDHLTVLISPRYKHRDDITTSLLLVHELYHALLRSNGEDIAYSCFDNEAFAHTIAYSYFYMLNQDEQNSLSTRYFAGASPELQGYFDTNKAILAMPGDDLAQKSKDYVMNSKYYQSQCEGE